MQKSIFFTATFLMIVCTTNAQTQKGNWMVGTSIGSGAYGKSQSDTKTSYSPQESTGKSKGFSFSISPFGMYFVQDNLAIGGSVGLGLTNNKSESYNTSSPDVSKTRNHSISISVGPQVRKYFGVAGSTGQPWVEIYCGVNPGSYRSNSHHTTYLTTSKSDRSNFGWNAGLGIGYSHFFNKLVAMQYFVNFRHTQNNSETEVTPSQGPAYSVNTTSTSDLIGFGVGLAIHLASKKKGK